MASNTSLALVRSLLVENFPGPPELIKIVVNFLRQYRWNDLENHPRDNISCLFMLDMNIHEYGSKTWMHTGEVEVIHNSWFTFKFTMNGTRYKLINGECGKGRMHFETESGIGIRVTGYLRTFG